MPFPLPLSLPLPLPCNSVLGFVAMRCPSCSESKAKSQLATNEGIAAAVAMAAVATASNTTADDEDDFSKIVGLDAGEAYELMRVKTEHMV